MRYLPLVLVLLWGCSHGAPSDRNVAFSAKGATEATLTFSHEVEIESGSKPSMSTAKEQVEKQVQHLFGPMERAEYKAAPKEDHTISNISIKKGETEGTYLISYDYEGTIVIDKGPRNKYDVILPNNPDSIFQKAMVRGHNPCTDDHYQTEGDFWYFWSPAPTYPKCKLKEGEDYQVVHGQIEREKNTRTTYPEYDRLANKDEIRIDVFFGMDDPSHNHDPAKSKDDGALSYRALKKRLEKSGFEFEAWSDADSRQIVKGKATLPYVEEGTKQSGDITMRVRLFFGETGIDEDSRSFHYFFKDGLANASVVLYDGHSGLGGHLDLDAIAEAEGFRFTMPKNRYQILFFNSCDSYTYYNTKFFQKKRKGRGNGIDPKASKNLDVLANGLGTEFDVEQNENFSLIDAIDDWAAKGKWTSYQKLAAEIDDDNLFTVNGDEDNPTKPR